ncbi:F-box/WD repeat-containing protein 9-like [Chrysoperla carnea]|uniref:F-box/WD repeat-containing protein 9-like n=1 Tax=Chrysoperla carnea TaxID=189513 RepID=UPI001D067218|nr:F-box/WD repeat-containing protein 9-like [Chrysoperla carnea]
MDEKYQENCTTSILDLPTEVLLKIFHMVDVETAHKSLYNVCQRFRIILDDQIFWKQYFYNLYGKKSHMVSYVSDDEIDWHNILYESNHRETQWTNYSDNFRSFLLHTVHYAPVDSIHLMENGSLVVSGSRDRGIALCNLSYARRVPEDAHLIDLSHVLLKPDAHGGWVWSIKSVDRDLYTGSWDNTIKVWSLDNGSVQQKCQFNGQQAVLSLSAKETLLAAGLWGKQIKLFDVRVGLECIHQYHIHNRAVLDVIIYGNYIISASEDRTVGIYDQRAQKKITNIPIRPPTKVIQGETNNNSMPLKICCKPNVIYVGDTKGMMHVIHPKLFKQMAKFEVTNEKVTGVAYETGMLATISTDNRIRISRPVNPILHYADFESNVSTPVSLDYYNDVMAVGGTNSVQVWIPKNSTILHPTI